MSDLLAAVPAHVIVSALRPHLLPGRAARLDAVAEARLLGIQPVLDDLRDPHNAGAVLRSCEAMGVLCVHVLSRRHLFRTATRVTQGCEKWLKLERWSAAPPLGRALRSAGIRLYVGVPQSRVHLADLDVSQPIALGFGNEHTGISPELREIADGEFTISMYGCSQSLNVSVSAAIALQHVTEARRRVLGRSGDLDPEALTGLRARYYASDLREPEQIVARYLDASVGA